MILKLSKYIFFFGVIVMIVTAITLNVQDWLRHEDPAIAALQEAKYTNIHFIGDRKGVCDPDP